MIPTYIGIYIHTYIHAAVYLFILLSPVHVNLNSTRTGCIWGGSYFGAKTTSGLCPKVFQRFQRSHVHRSAPTAVAGPNSRRETGYLVLPGHLARNFSLYFVPSDLIHLSISLILLPRSPRPKRDKRRETQTP